MIFQSLKTVEDPVMEPLFPKLIPEVLHRVEFRRIGRKGQEPHVFRNHQVLIPVPPSPVHHHDQSVLRVPGRHVIQKDLHAGPVDVRQDQAVQGAFRNGNRRIRIGVFLGDLRGHHRSMGTRTPAPSGPGDPSKPGFVLEQEAQGSLSLPLPVDSLERVVQFFFQSSWTRGSDFRCRLSGDSFLQP